MESAAHRWRSAGLSPRRAGPSHGSGTMADDITIHSLLRPRTPASLPSCCSAFGGRGRRRTPRQWRGVARPGLTNTPLLRWRVISSLAMIPPAPRFWGEPILRDHRLVMTLPTWRRRGVATRLMEHALPGCAKRGPACFYRAALNGHRIYTPSAISRATVSYYFALPAPEARPTHACAPPCPARKSVRALSTPGFASDGYVPVEPGLWRRPRSALTSCPVPSSFGGGRPDRATGRLHHRVQQ